MEKEKAIIEEKQRMLEAWSLSGQSIKTFCKERNIAYPSFFYWQRKLNKKQGVSAGTFLEVPSRVVSSVIPQVEVIYSNGNRIVLYSLADVLLLKQLVQ